MGIGRITGSGATLGQIIRVEWSPSGLGSNLRPVVAALTAHGAIVCFGEYVDLRKDGSSTTQSRSFKNWRILWGLGAQLPLPIASKERRATLGTDIEIMDERIVSFCWSKEILPGRALLAYATDEKEVVIMSIQFYSKDSAPNEKGWEISEVGRFNASGPHAASSPLNSLFSLRHTNKMRKQMLDELDPDFTTSGTAFSLKWSPWVTNEGTQTSALSYIAHNHVGFRRITINELWKLETTPSITVEEHDTKGICLSLSVDAFLEWENTVSCLSPVCGVPLLIPHSHGKRTASSTCVELLRRRLLFNLFRFP